MKYRDSFKLTYDMLAHLKDGEKLRTSMMYASSTSWTVYSKRLRQLIDNGLVEEIDAMDRPITLTEKGWKFIEYYEKIVDMLPPQ